MLFQLAAGAALAFLALLGTAQAGSCPGNPGALGTSRVIAVDPAKHPRIGLLEYSETLPLQDHEVVLTFDDGPLPPHTNKVLDALAAECVKATFFVVGQMAESYPALLQREYREGHTIGTHTMHHPHLNRLRADAAAKEITDGIAAATKVLGKPGAVAPFFRFPYLDESSASEAKALELGLAIWSTDFHGSDWERLTPAQVSATAIGRLERFKKGILMLHDIHERTALALPLILAELKTRGYRVVQAVPAAATPPQTAAKPNEWKATAQ
ncbi:MAG: polysaccharide deacetylase family protein [Rhodomicrobium sp.]